MGVSVFDLFKIGIGPSSSHTVGPMRAAARFVSRWLVEPAQLDRCVRVRAEVFGSLALTGRGHGTNKALLMGLEGHLPNRIDPDLIPAALERIRKHKRIRLHGSHEIDFDEKRDLVMNKRQKLPFHTNGAEAVLDQISDPAPPDGTGVVAPTATASVTSVEGASASISRSPSPGRHCWPGPWRKSR